ncbi:signal transduction histidine kinase [Cytobacillus purgationiresistens]|uniref:histidine kinase n=2 Tax=Cytobacillus purgationiresistens TaxID=863449 RepID=A0ABU0ADL7_9BACI|nr:signal transduction histidine kinase [Cytobacillus purgationiresistens]
MHAGTYEKLVAFFAKRKNEILHEWADKIRITNNDPFKESVLINGEVMYLLLMRIFSDEGKELDNILRELALTVAKQRVKANINIGDFVFNVNIGREVTQKYLFQIESTEAEMRTYIQQMNYCFDQFLYYAVSFYSENQNQIIKEKNQFIDSTHKDRLTLLGQMTSSFIHEFRNPLTSIQGFIQLLKSDYPNMKYLEIISNEIEQLNFRISQFLLLSKKEIIGKDKTKFSLNLLIEEVLNFLYPSILDSKVKIIKEIQKDDVILIGYKDEIRQVLINIIFNAIDVLSPERLNPTIIISLGITDMNQVQIHIANNGPEIPSNLVNTIFEPFFTTKTLGTGLGLFVCREIIEKHRGSLSCISGENQTIFSIILPIER